MKCILSANSFRRTVLPRPSLVVHPCFSWPTINGQQLPYSTGARSLREDERRVAPTVEQRGSVKAKDSIAQVSVRQRSLRAQNGGSELQADGNVPTPQISSEGNDSFQEEGESMVGLAIRSMQAFASNGVEGSTLHSCWINRLGSLKRSASHMLLPTLDFSNALGFSSIGDQLSMSRWALRRKEARPELLHLLRCGDFYEMYGIDALMLVEHCGLSPMASKLRAGFPVKNIQDMLDMLTDEGFSIAVYEEYTDDAAVWRKGGRRKHRFLSQIVGPASPTYLHNLSLRAGDIPVRENRSFYGVLRTAADGYHLVEVESDTRSCRMEHGLTREGVQARLQLAVPCEPLFVQVGFPPTQAPREIVVSTVKDLSTVSVRRELLRDHPTFEAFRDAVIGRICALLGHEADSYNIQPVADSPVEVECTDSHSRPRTLSLLSASQLGLLSTGHIPDLSRMVVPSDAPVTHLRFFRRWLMCPPPHRIADCMSRLCCWLSQSHEGIPNYRPPDVHKILVLLTHRQCNAPLFRDILQTLTAAQDYLTRPLTEGRAEALIDLWEVVRWQTQSQFDQQSHFLHDVSETITKIEQIVSLDPEDAVGYSSSSEPLLPYELMASFCHIPKGTRRGFSYTTAERDALVDEHTPDDMEKTSCPFFEKNEARFRGRVRRCASKEVTKAYDGVEKAVENLAVLILQSFADTSIEMLRKMEPEALRALESLQSMRPLWYNNILNTLSVNRSSVTKVCLNKGNSDLFNFDFQPFKDRRGREVEGKFTTSSLEVAVTAYLDAVALAERAVERCLRDLSEEIASNAAAIVVAANYLLVLQAAGSHTKQAMLRSWSPAVLSSGPASAPDVKAKQKDLHSRDIEETAEGHLMAERRTEKTERSRLTGSLVFRGLFPYWLQAPGSVRRKKTADTPEAFFEDEEEDFVQFPTPGAYISKVAIKTDVTLDSQMLLLTAPNMSGKSTLMRSVAAAALLANCGLFVPADFCQVPRLDGFFLRLNSSDVPAEGRSSFAQEMEEVKGTLRDATKSSLVMVDEVGRGTFPEDGAAIAGAVLEALDRKGCNGIFTTHLTSMLSLPLKLERVVRYTLGYQPIRDGIKWTYALKPGVCADSLAFHTARTYGVPAEVLKRGQELLSVIKKEDQKNARNDDRLTKKSTHGDLNDRVGCWDSPEPSRGSSPPSPTPYADTQSNLLGMKQLKSTLANRTQ